MQVEAILNLRFFDSSKSSLSFLTLDFLIEFLIHSPPTQLVLFRSHSLSRPTLLNPNITDFAVGPDSSFYR